MTKHASIYPSEDELQAIQKIVSITERALKLVSDIITDQDASAKGKEEDKEKKEPPKDRWEKSALMCLKAERKKRAKQYITSCALQSAEGSDAGRRSRQRAASTWRQKCQPGPPLFWEADKESAYTHCGTSSQTAHGTGSMQC